MKQATYAGSFDPFSIGHLEILRRSFEIFDRDHVVVGVNRRKKPMFSELARIDLIKQSISHLSEERESWLIGKKDISINLRREDSHFSKW